MELYKKIDIKNFNRAEYFQYFMSVGTTLEFTAKIDITKALEKCRAENIHLQSYLLFQLCQTLNSIENFRYDILNGDFIVWKEIVPTFSSFNKRTKLFFTLYADMKEDYPAFDMEYKRTTKKYADANTIVPQVTLPKNIFNVSCIPWLHYEHFSSNSNNENDKIIKMITLGKYAELNGKFLIPLTIQVSHAIVDGYHISLFYNKLQEKLNSVKENSL